VRLGSHGRIRTAANPDVPRPRPGLPRTVRTSILTAVRKLLPLLGFIPLLLSGCSSETISVFTNTSVATVARPTAVPTAVPPPLVASTGYDQFAGNCPDAAVEDTNLISFAAAQNYNFDMSLTISPTSGCGADPKSPAYTTFVRQVGQATLTLNALDTAWVYGYVATRDTFLTNLFAQLQTHYPSLANVTITVLYGGNTRATLTYNGHGQPLLQVLYS
jgi:hypothetical protein